MKRKFYWLPLLLAALLLAGCGRQAEELEYDIADGPVPMSGGPVLEADGGDPAAGDLPLPEWAQAQPVPDFLSGEQQQLFLRAFSAAGQFLMGCGTMGLEEIPLEDGSLPPQDSPERITLDGRDYIVSQGRYRQWEDFQAMLDGLFTPEYKQELLQSRLGDGSLLAVFRATPDGLLCYLDASRGSSLEYDWCETPDAYELDSQTEDEICFHLIGHYARLDYGGELPVPVEEYTERFPIRLVRTDAGWRVAEIHIPW